MKKQLIIGFFLLLYANIQAQETNQYLYFNAGGGFHNLSYKLPYGIEKGGCDYSLNAGYGFNIDKHWGFQTVSAYRLSAPYCHLKLYNQCSCYRQRWNLLRISHLIQQMERKTATALF